MIEYRINVKPILPYWTDFLILYFYFFINGIPVIKKEIMQLSWLSTCLIYFPPLTTHIRKYCCRFKANERAMSMSEFLMICFAYKHVVMIYFHTLFCFRLFVSFFVLHGHLEILNLLLIEVKKKMNKGIDRPINNKNWNLIAAY